MSDSPPAVRLERVGKIFSKERDPTSVYRALKGGLAAALQSAESVRALEGITCAVACGDKVGLVGDNGAGKTTLLKIIAGLYQPSSGSVAVDGDVILVAGLGIGMIDELTVEQNLLVYGAIHGLTRPEMRSRIPEILEWAELPGLGAAKLKTLSSGMRSRLAFSAMRTVETTIYLLDEVLTAGDRRFVDKCAAVFEAYRASPKTFVVATHSIAFARTFCNKVLWLHKGKQMAFGEPDMVLDRYTSFTGEPRLA